MPATPATSEVPLTYEGDSLQQFSEVPDARGRRVALLAVHHVEVDGTTYTGGAEKYILTTLQALLDAGASVHVGYSGTSIYAPLLEAVDPRRLTVERTGWINDVLAGDGRLRIKTIRERRRWLRATGADTVFAVQQANGGAFAASIAAAKLLGFRVVASIRQPCEPLPRSPGRKWLGIVPSPEIWRRRLLWRRQIPARLCDALIYNSRQVADSYAAEYGFPSNRAWIVHNGEFPQPDDLPPFHNPLRIGAVGRVTRAKGADTLMEAFTKIARRHPECSLTYFGDGELIQQLSAQASAHGLGDRVTFVGHMHNRDQIYSQVDILAQLSRRESMANSVIEAMARGIPAVVSNVGGMSEAVVDGQTGLIVPPEDVNAATHALNALLDAGDRYTCMSEAALSRARDHFDIRRLMRDTVETILGIGAWSPRGQSF